MKIVLIGAGSESFGRGQIADILQSKHLRNKQVTLSLVDVDESALDRMSCLAGRIRSHADSDIRIEATTDRRTALPGADYVITAVSRQRMPLWEQDFRVPLAHGFRHCLGENGGPGALFHALRSLELIIPICHDIEELCPEALLLNFTNPEARVLHAICHLTRVRAAGICHGVFSAIGAVCEYLERPIQELEFISAGMNHFYCVLKVRDRATGEDLLPRVLEHAAADTDAHRMLFRKLAEVFGVVTFPSDDHVGEYLACGSEYMGVKWPYGIESRRVKNANSPASPATIEDYASGKAPIDRHVLAPSGETTVPMICDIELDRGGWHHAVNVLNTKPYIPNLPPNCVIEIPATADRTGIHPQHVGPIPETFAAMMRTQFTIHELLTEAYRTRTRRLLLQALLLDPVVHSITEAEKLLDEMLDLQQGFLPEFS